MTDFLKMYSSLNIKRFEHHEMMNLQNLKFLRTKAGLTQEQLAQKAGVSRFTIALLESGKQQEVKSSTIIKLADALNIDIDTLLSPKS